MYSFIFTVGRGKDLNDGEKRQIIKELGKSTPLENIAKKINCHLVTVKRFLHDPMKKRKTRSDRGILKSVTKRDLSSLKRNLRKVRGAISKRIFQEFGLTGIPKTTRNRILGQIAKHKASQKRPQLSSRHKDLRLNWARKYMKSDMKYVLSTDESRATLDGRDGWAKGWVINGDQAPVRRRQQGGGGVMIWAGIIGDELIGPSCTRSTRSKTYFCYLLSVPEECTRGMARRGTIIAIEGGCIHA